MSSTWRRKKNSKLIMAINEDFDDPFFFLVDLKVEAELYTALPELVGSV
jgi:electron transfer flavoprotein alpha subunit